MPWWHLFLQYPSITLLGGLAVSVAFFLYMWFYYLPYQVLKRNGIDGPPASFFYGHYKQSMRVGIMKFLEQLHEDYGRNAGFYFGKRPTLSITDVDLVKLVTIKEFDCFINRPDFPTVVKDDDVLIGLVHAKDRVWRLGRQALSPTFSPFKMKAMTPLIRRSVDTLVKVMQKHCDTGQSVEVFKLYGSFTMEALLSTAFGRLVGTQKGEADKLLQAAETVLQASQEGKVSSKVYVTMLLSNFPWFIYVLRYLFRGNEHQKAYHTLHRTASQLIQERRDEQCQPGKYKDLLQLMIEATVDTGTGQKRLMTVQEICSHAITMMLAGYETTANTLNYASYLLALHPHVQEKLQKEIGTFFEENQDVSAYKATQDIEYLDMVVKEVMRLYPAIPLFQRQCCKEFKYKDITIPLGCSVLFPSYLLQKDPKYWENPEKFDPMRFSAEAKAERPQQCYMPFGSGPRNCIGMRFALLEIKVALIEVLKRFTFVRAPDTQVPLETTIGIVMTPKVGTYLRIVSKKAIAT